MLLPRVIRSPILPLQAITMSQPVERNPSMPRDIPPTSTPIRHQPMCNLTSNIIIHINVHERILHPWDTPPNMFNSHLTILLRFLYLIHPLSIGRTLRPNNSQR